MAKQWVESRKTICIDFNGVLDMYTGWKGADYTYPIRAGAKEFLEELKRLGYKVVIWTAADENLVCQWLFDNDLYDLYDSITCEKIPAIIYIDDRAICFKGDFQYTLAQVKDFRTHWETDTIQER